MHFLLLDISFGLSIIHARVSNDGLLLSLQAKDFRLPKI